MDASSLHRSLKTKLQILADQDDVAALMALSFFMDNSLKGFAQPERGQANRQKVKQEPNGAQTGWAKEAKTNLRLLVSLIAGLPSLEVGSGSRHA
eukprot:56069-Eustigmatos_ZCMA.PRE.1